MSGERLANLYAELERIRATLLAVEDGTLPFIEAQHPEPIVPGQIAEEFRVSVQTANNRLLKLIRVGVLERERRSIKGGGKAFVYRLVNSPKP